MSYINEEICDGWCNVSLHDCLIAGIVTFYLD